MINDFYNDIRYGTMRSLTLTSDGLPGGFEAGGVVRQGVE